MRTIEATLAPRALWLFADFEISKQPHRRWWHEPLVKSMFLFFRLTTGLTVFRLPNYSLAFERVGFSVREEQKFYGELIVSRVYSKPE